MTTILDRTANRAPIPGRASRLSLTPKTGSAASALDGAWWPRSRDLAAELPSLADALEARWGRITRIAVNPGRWRAVPRRVSSSGHALHVGWFTELDPDKIILLSYAVSRCDLLVVPPEAQPASAARLMSAAAVPGSVLTPGVLLSDEAATAHREREDRSGEELREADGGAVLGRIRGPVAHPVVGARMIPLPGYMRR
ncbi:DUF5994 family protein [Streptomyces sp. NPDC058992]|uniref:DUF5994 family protein n=1 Tax=Streptomyces sp. NPDC058992 TaxID=3346688 RepID=UPI003687B0CC